MAAARPVRQASLAKDLRDDARQLIDGPRRRAATGTRRATPSSTRLLELLTKKHPSEKVLVFTQFADTVRYLEAQLEGRGVTRLAGVTGDIGRPDRAAPGASARSATTSATRSRPSDELRVLVATDVLSEGQNLQDCAIVVNYDLPWAIIRLIQRAGRVDRIGQKAEKILCYSFLPADGVERIIRLRARVRQRLRENAEVVGTDEAFFEDERERPDRPSTCITRRPASSTATPTPKSTWPPTPTRSGRTPSTAIPSCRRPSRRCRTSSTRPSRITPHRRRARRACSSICAPPRATTRWPGWTRAATASPNRSSRSCKAAECAPDTPALPRQDNHHELVAKGVELIVAEEKTVGGQLGPPVRRALPHLRAAQALRRAGQGHAVRHRRSSPRRSRKSTAIPLRQSATDTLNRQLRAGIGDDKLAELVIALRDEDRLCIVHEEERNRTSRRSSARWGWRRRPRAGNEP